MLMSPPSFHFPNFTQAIRGNKKTAKMNNPIGERVSPFKVKRASGIVKFSSAVGYVIKLCPGNNNPQELGLEDIGLT